MKEKILEALYEKKGDYISGEELASLLGVSRTAIWKNINQIKLEGYNVEATKKGYRILETNEKLLPMDIKARLEEHNIGASILHFDSIDSTNNHAKKIAYEVQEGTIVISEEQLAGRGRMGKDWSSPRGEGIWMSIVLKPMIPPTEASMLTQVAAAAVCRAIRRTTGLPALIKWPNDIVVNGKKVCGILTEMAGELNEVSYIIVGIGINVNISYFPEELRLKATSLLLEKKERVDRNDLTASIINEFAALYSAYITEKNFDVSLDICRVYSAVIGKTIYLVKGEEREQVLALDITDEGLLKIRGGNGEEATIISGEVSIRGEGDYI